MLPQKGLVEEVKEDAAKIHEAGEKGILCVSICFSEKCLRFLSGIPEKLNSCSVDGVVVKSLDAVWFVHRYLPQMPMILDQGLYTYNHRAQEILREFCPIRMTAPYELNRGELKKRDNTDSEMVLYGYLPLMTSAQCVHANTGKCDTTSVVAYLKDRYGKFPGQK